MADRAVRKTVDLVLLVGLLRGPASGYDLTAWMRRETSHYFAVGHSSIYPALARLEGDGLVRHRSVAGGAGPARKVYEPTEAGREAVLAWAAAPTGGDRAEALVRSLGFGFLPPAVARQRLGEMRADHAATLDRYRGMERSLAESHGAGELSRPAWVGAMVTLRRGLRNEEAGIAWCDDALALVGSTGGDPPQADG